MVRRSLWPTRRRERIGSAAFRCSLAGPRLQPGQSSLELAAGHKIGIDPRCHRASCRSESTLAGNIRCLMNGETCARPDLKLLSVVIPARDEEGCIASTVEKLEAELRRNEIPHEIVVVDDGSTDGTWSTLAQLQTRLPVLAPIQ